MAINKAITAILWISGVLVGGSTALAQSNEIVETVETSADTTAEQALALMQEPERAYEGSNAWVTLMTWQRGDMTAAERQAVADEYVAQIERWLDAYISAHLADTTPPPLPPLPGERRALPSARDSILCAFATPAADCLRVAKEQPQALADALKPYTDVLERMQELATHGHYYSPLPKHGNLQWPNTRFVSLSLSAHALQHVNGDSQAALTGLCHDANSGRMLIRDADNLLIAMTGRRLLTDSVDLAAQIIAELPVDTPLPEICTTAFARFSPQEISLCPAMRGEFAFIHSYIAVEEKRFNFQASEGHGPTASGWNQVLALDAQTKSTVCQPETAARLLADEKFKQPPPPSSTWLNQCTEENPVCMYARMAHPEYASYVHRMQDTAAQLQMMQVILWSRQHYRPEADHPSLLEIFPPDLYISRYRPLTLSQDGLALEVPAYSPRVDAPVRLLLPAAL